MLHRLQLILARALLERRWPSAADALGDGRPTEGAVLRSQRDDFFRIRGLYRSLQRLEREREFAQARVLFQMIQLGALQNPLFRVYSQVSAQVRKIRTEQNLINPRHVAQHAKHGIACRKSRIPIDATEHVGPRCLVAQRL